MQKCKSCGASWETKEEKIKCPFCGSYLEKWKEISTIEEAFTLIIERYGQEIFKEKVKFLGLLSDYAPNFTKERKLVKTVIESGAYREICEADHSKRQYVVQKYISILSDSYFIDREWAERSLRWCVQSLESVGQAPLRAAPADRKKEVAAASVRENPNPAPHAAADTSPGRRVSKLAGLSGAEVSEKIKELSNEELLQELFLLRKEAARTKKRILETAKSGVLAELLGQEETKIESMMAAIARQEQEKLNKERRSGDKKE